VESRLTYSYGGPDVRRILLAVAGVLLVAGVGVGAWVVLSRGDEAASPQAAPSTSAGAPASSAGPADPDSPQVRAARTVLHRWSSRELPYPRWWQRLRPLLTAGAREAYAATDPRRVPALTALEQPRMRPGPSRDTSTVWFRTGEGRFGVDLARSTRRDPWRGVRILFPGQTSVFQ
jgi:hypothetical protein